MGIRIEFDTAGVTPDEMRALAGMLAELSGDGEVTRYDTVAELMADLDANALHSEAVGDPGTPQEPDAPPPVSVGFGGDTPSGPAAPVPPELTASHRDLRGLPWDERIHSASRALNADGTWRKRRGVADELIERVEAELLGVSVEEPVTDAEREAVEAPFGAIGEVASEAQAALEYGMGFHSGAPAPAVVVVPPPPAAAVPQPPAPVAINVAAGVAVPLVSFPSLISRVTAAVTAGTVTMLQVSALCQELGVEALPLVGGRPDLFQPLSERLASLGV